MMAMWEKCLSAVLPISQTSLNRVAPPGSAVKKSSTAPVAFGQQGRMFHLPFHFVRNDLELNAQLFPSSSRRVRIAAALAV
jgi:hypothetical protein